MKNLLFIIPLFLTLQAYSQAKVGLINGEVKHHQKIKVRTFFSEGKIVADKETEYPLSEVAYYETEYGYFRVEPTATGGYQLLQRTSTGLIETYFIIKNNMHYDPNMGWMSTSQRMDYYAFDGEPVQKMKYKNLMRDIGQVPECQELLKKGKTLNTITAISIVMGLGIAVGSLLSSTAHQNGPDESVHIPAGVWVGVIIAQIPWFTGSAARDRYQQAIEVYNYQYR